jgi:uroporphyrin-III C-methyltransferase
MATADEDDTLVIADRLVAPEILALIDCELKVSRKLPRCAELAQEEIYWWIHHGLQVGKHVIRLKIGDPFVFGRREEEILTCRTFGVETNVIPVHCACCSMSIPLFWVFVQPYWLFSFSFSFADRYVCLFSSHVGKHSRHASRRVRSGCFVCRVRPRWDVTRLDSIPQGTDATRGNMRSIAPIGGVPVNNTHRHCGKAGCPDHHMVMGDMATIADLAKRYCVKPPSTIIVGTIVQVLLVADSA